MAKGLFDRYIWLIDTIYRAGKITFEEINKRWLRTEMSNGEEIPYEHSITTGKRLKQCLISILNVTNELVTIIT